MDVKRSALALIVANLVPVAGVLFWGWSVFEIVLLYWIENLVIGAVNVLRMATCRTDGLGSIIGTAMRSRYDEALRASGHTMPVLPFASGAFKLFLIPFFVVHYGGFCFGHGTFIFAIFSEGGLAATGGPTGAIVVGLSHLDGPMLLGAASLVASHLYSFFHNYLGKGEYRRTSLRALMVRPYGRIVALHITIIAGAMLVMLFGSHVPLLLVLIAAKVVVDLKLHSIERGKLGSIIEHGVVPTADDARHTPHDTPASVGGTSRSPS